MFVGALECVSNCRTGRVSETWSKFSQSLRSFAFKAGGLAEYTTAGGTVKGPGSEWFEPSTPDLRLTLAG